MPSFDVVSELDNFEVKNTIENAKRALENRWDFKNVEASIDLNVADNKVVVKAESDYQVNQLVDIVLNAAIKRGIEYYSLDIAEDYEHSGKTYSKDIKFKNGIDKDQAKQITKIIKDSKIKVSASIQGEKVRVQGKNRDDLQECIALLKEKQAELNLALQFNNFRD